MFACLKTIVSGDLFAPKMNRIALVEVIDLWAERSYYSARALDRPNLDPRVEVGMLPTQHKTANSISSQPTITTAHEPANCDQRLTS